MAGAVAIPSRDDTTTIAPVPEKGRRGLGAGGVAVSPYGAPAYVGFPRYQPFEADESASLPGGSIDYRRPYYVNDYATDHDSTVVDYNPQTSSVYRPGPTTQPVRTDSKRYDVATLRREFGSWSQSYPHGALVNRGVFRKLAAYGPLYDRPTLQFAPRPRKATQPSTYLRGLASKVQMTGPYFPLLTHLSPTTSYGSLTAVLPALPARSVTTEGIYG